MDKFKALQTLVAVATRGSLAAAARAEGVAAAVIGRRLDALEQHLGVRLLLRSTRRLALTTEGAALLEQAQRLLAELAEAEASVSAGGARAQGHLRLTAPAGFGRRHVAPLLPDFRQQHPQVMLSLNLSDRVIDLAAEGYDCAVRVGDLPDSALVSVRLADNHRLCVAAPSYVQRHGQPQHPSDLQRFDCLALTSEASQTRGWAFRATPRPTGRGAAGHLECPATAPDSAPTPKSATAPGPALLHVRPRGALDCTDGQVLYDWCLAGHGIAWRSAWEVQADVQAGRLLELLPTYAAPPSGIYAVFPQRKHLPLRTRAWIDFLKTHYAQPLFWARGRGAAAAAPDQG